jgi:serine phosphatase RsbU (regulator of sigma subunit)
MGSSGRAVTDMSREPDEAGRSARTSSSVANARERDLLDADDREHLAEMLIARLRHEAEVRDEELDGLRERLQVAAHELEDLRAIRDALTPPGLPQRPGLELAAAFVPAVERVSGDFYLVAEGPRESTLLLIGDVVGHGLHAARRAAFVRTTFAATAPFSDDPRRLLSLANTALVERAGTSVELVTAACMTYLPDQRLLRWAYAGHPPALRIRDGRELLAPTQGVPLGLSHDPDYAEGSLRSSGPTGLLLYTDGLTKVQHDGALFGLEGVSAVLGELRDPSAGEAVATLRTRLAAYAGGALTDDLCMLAARID